MRKGCVVFTVLLAMGIAIAGYFGYTYIKRGLDVPAELKAFAERDSVLGKIRSQASAPGRADHLTKQQVALFIGALDSAASGWRNLQSALDSLHLTKGKGDDGDSVSMNIWASPRVIRELIRAPLVTRRAVVSYLNTHHLSWAQYLWIKERTVAAAGINEGDLDSAENAIARAHLKAGGSVTSIKRKLTNSDEFFRKVEEIRKSGLIDEHDRELAEPYRDILLSRGVPALMGTETNLTDKRGGLTLNTDGSN